MLKTLGKSSSVLMTEGLLYHFRAEYTHKNHSIIQKYTQIERIFFQVNKRSGRDLYCTLCMHALRAALTGRNKYAI